MEKRIICLAVSLMIFVFSQAHAINLPVEFDFDRPGCDYRSFAVPRANDLKKFYNVCQDACGADSSCQAWNFDNRSQRTPMCFLKSCVPVPTVNVVGVIGGVKFSQ
jgi:PAN domain